MISRKGRITAALIGLVLLIGAGFFYMALQRARTPGTATPGAEGPAGVTPGAPTPITLLPTPTPAALATVPPVATASPMATPPVTEAPSPTATLASDDGKRRFPLAVDEAQVKAIVAGLSLEQKVGQMLMVGLPEETIDAVARQRLSDLYVGGVILLEHNSSSAQQTAAFTGALQALALQASGVPLFIGWNHEGGPVVRRAAQVTAFPSAMAVGATNRPALAYAVGRAMAEEMRSLGVNMNFGPVLDVNSETANPVIGLRAFGENPASVADFGSQTIAGLQDAGAIAVAKHFPGHGGVDVDSHLDLPILNAELEQLYLRELPPFFSAVEAGVGGVMVAHLQIPALDPDGWPSSLSPRVIENILRQPMAYDGVVMTDDMSMGAIANHYTLEEATVQAVLAGNDLLLTVETSNQPDRMHNALVQAALSGRLPLERIDQAVRRIVRLKLAYDLGSRQDTVLLPNQAAHQELAARVGRLAVTVLQDAPHWLPLQLPNRRLLLVTPATMHAGTVSGDGLSLLGEMAAARGLAVQEIFYYPDAPWSVGLAQAEAQAASVNADAVVVLTWNAALRHAQQGDTAQETMARALLARGQEQGQPVAVVFSQLPYDSLRLAEAPVQVAMYGDMVGQVEGLLAILLGE